MAVFGNCTTKYNQIQPLYNFLYNFVQLLELQKARIYGLRTCLFQFCSDGI